MDLGWLETGDLVEIVGTNGTLTSGTIVNINANSIIIRRRNGLKSSFNSEKIESISQIESLESEEPETALPAKPQNKDILCGGNMSIENEYEKLLLRVKEILAKPAIDFAYIKEYKNLARVWRSSYQAVWQSIEYALKKDRTSLDSKIDMGVRKLQDMYRSTGDINLLLFAAYFMSLYTSKKTAKITHFCDAVNMILEYGQQQSAIDFFLSNGKLPDSLGLWQYYINAPQILCYTFSKDYMKSQSNNDRILKYITEIYESPLHNHATKNIIFYALLKSLEPSMEPITELCSSSELLDNLYKGISDILTIYDGEGTIIFTTDGNGTIVTDELKMVPYSDAGRLNVSVGDIVEFRHDRVAGSAVVVKVKKKEDADKTNLQRLNRICVSKPQVVEAQSIKRKIAALLMPSTSETLTITNDKKSTYTPKGYAAKFTKQIQTAKTPDETSKVAVELSEFLKDNPSNGSAVKDLISLNLRKNDPHYDEAITVFENYRSYFESDTVEMVKLYRIVYDAFWGAKRYDDAIAALEYIINYSPTVAADYYVKMAQCYLRLQQYSSALEWCRKALNVCGSNRASVSGFAALACEFAIYIGLKDFKSAEKIIDTYAKLTPKTEKVDEMRKALDDVVSGQISTEDVEERFDETWLVISSDKNFLLSELYTPYLKYRLDNCEFSQIRDRQYDETTRRYTWDPPSLDAAMDIFQQIIRTTGYLSKRTNSIRQGVVEEVADKYLNLSKIAEVCLMKAESDVWELNSFEYQERKSIFLTASARYMWLLYNSYQVRNQMVPGTCAFFLKECIGLYSRDYENAQRRLDFYDALNRYLMIISEQEDYTHVELARDAHDYTDPSITKAESIISKNVMDAFAHNPKGLLKALGSIIAQYSTFKEIAVDCLRRANISDDKIIAHLTEVIDISSMIKPGDDAVSMEELLSVYASSLKKNYSNITMAVNVIVEAMSTQDVLSIVSNTEQIRSYCLDDKKTILSATDIARCVAFTRLISGEEDDSFTRLMQESSYELSNRTYTSINTMSLVNINDYKENPTEIAFEYLIDAHYRLMNAAREIRDKITESSMPRITIMDDYADEGYFPINETVKLMLRIANGQNGEICTTATNLCIDIRPDGIEKKCNLKQSHFENIISSLPGGKEVAVDDIELPLTAEGCKPNTMINLEFIITYQTINGSQKTFSQVLVIYIKGKGDFTEIPSPYSFNPLLPGSRNSSMFVGRDDDIENLSNEILNSGNGKTIIIYGQYRSGKTSLGKFLSAKIQERSPHFIIADAGTVLSNWGIHDIVNNIVLAILDAIDERYSSIPENLECYKGVSANQSNYIRYFTNFVKSLKQTLETDMPGVRLLVELDEFGRFLIAHDASSFLEVWKSIMAYGTFDAVLIGHDSITRIIQNNFNAFGVVSLFHISYLAYEPTVRLITEPTVMVVEGEKRNRFIGGAIDYIWQQSGGNVYYVHYICNAAIAFMNRRHMNVVNEIYVQKAISESLGTMTAIQIEDYGHPLFQSSDGADGVSDYQNKVVLDAISKTSRQAAGSGFETVLNYLNQTYGVKALSQECIKKVLNSLLSRKVIKYENGQYDIIVKFYRDFLNDTIMSMLELE